MSAGFTYLCTDCDYKTDVRTSIAYIQMDDRRKRTVNPEDFREIDRLLSECEGWNAEMSFGEKNAFMKARLFYGNDYICRECLHVWFINGDTDPTDCPKCASQATTQKWFLRDTPCPKCKSGTVTGELEPDWIT